MATNAAVPTRRDRLRYLRANADVEYWSAHWAGESLDHLEQVAAVSPLSRWLEERIAPGDRLLEAGCGMGQYVRHFAARGTDVVGVDYVEGTVEAYRRRYPQDDVRVADIERLPFPDASFDVYLSLGVIEHYEHGPGVVLAEARRVLRPGGTAIFSVPYLNLSRRALRRLIARQQRGVAARGGAFYQYAMTERALDAVLLEGGLEVVDRGYYDPGRGVRDVRDLGAVLRGRAATPESTGATPPSPDGPPVPGRLDSPLRRLALYSPPVLRSFAHMQIVACRAVG